MKNLILLAGIAALGLSFSSQVFADKAQNGKGGEKFQASKANDGDRKSGGGSKSAGQAFESAQGKAKQLDSSNGKAENASGAKSDLHKAMGVHADNKAKRQAQKVGVISIDAEQIQSGENSRVRKFENGRYAWREPSYQGCPPGLVKKGNGCLPPGQARKLAGFNAQQMQWTQYSSWLGANRSGDWRYDQGYAYRINPSTNFVQSIVPLIGGALFGGNAWPQGYTDYQVSPYYYRFYGAGENNDVRYADGAMFGVDPKTQMIGSIVGLLTGDNWNVGSPAPHGYDLYNVPSNYRDQYADSDTSAYRYNDGYVYEVDPTTQIVRKIIELVF